MNPNNTQHNGTSRRRGWFARLIRRVISLGNNRLEGAPFEETFEFEGSDHPEQYCQHGRLTRWFARQTARLTGRTYADRSMCILCGLRPVSATPMEYILTVWFHSGDTLEYLFLDRKRDECYRIGDSALHIYLEESVLSYSLELVAAVNFGGRTLAPAAPEVAAAEDILARYETRNK